MWDGDEDGCGMEMRMEVGWGQGWDRAGIRIGMGDEDEVRDGMVRVPAQPGCAAQPSLGPPAQPGPPAQQPRAQAPSLPG